MNTVGFTGIQSTTFSDMVNRPQAYKNPASPAAATNVSGDQFEGKAKKKHTVLKLAGAALAVAGLLVAGNKSGVFEKIPKVGKHIAKAGQAIEDKVVGLCGKVKSLIPTAQSQAADDAAQQAADKLDDAVVTLINA